MNAALKSTGSTAESGNRPDGKPRLFVGSSVESLELAYALQAELEHDAIVTVWKQGIFKPSRQAVSALLRAAKTSDAAVFVFTPDDVAKIRNEVTSIVRDNVIFEFGLFIGSLSPERVWFLVPRGEELHLPTDLLSLTPLTFRPNRSDDNIQAAIGSACYTIREDLKTITPCEPAPVAAKVAAGIVTNERDDNAQSIPEVLLVKRRDTWGGLKWQFPAGAVHPGDVSTTRVVREVRDETGIECEVSHDLGNRVHPVTFVSIHYFGCRYIRGEVVNGDSDENAEVGWFPIAKAKELIGPTLFPPVANYLDYLLSSEPKQ